MLISWATEGNCNYIGQLNGVFRKVVYKLKLLDNILRAKRCTTEQNTTWKQLETATKTVTEKK